MPIRQQIHIDRALTNVSVAYMQSEDVFIAAKVFPIVPVQKQSDTYFIYKKEDFFRDEAAERANGTESAGGDYELEQAPPYFCRIYAFHKDVTEQERVNADDPLKPDQDSTEFVSHKLLLRREVKWATDYFQSGVWGTEFTGVDADPSAGQTLRWNLASSDPIKVIRNAKTAMTENTGYAPNKLVLSPYVYNALCDHPLILDRIKYTQKGIVTKELLASLFEVDEILIPFAIQNTQAKGKDGQMSFVMGKHALLCYAAPNPGLKQPSAGYTFAWKGLQGAGAYGNRIVRIPMPWLGMDTERIEGEMAFDNRVVAKDLGIFFKDIVA
jgi:hypothetical protein